MATPTTFFNRKSSLSSSQDIPDVRAEFLSTEELRQRIEQEEKAIDLCKEALKDLANFLKSDNNLTQKKIESISEEIDDLDQDLLKLTNVCVKLKEELASRAEAPNVGEK